ncbi:MAG: ROK family protein [Sandaracinaceae bacterium]
MARPRIGVDLGGTKIEVIAFRGGEAVLRRRVPTPSDGYDAIVRDVRQLVLDAERELGEQATVGVGTPGALDPQTGVLKNANTTALNGQPLDRDLSRALDREIRIANDADCFALSEATDGAGHGARVVFGVIAGTGTGGGVVVDGRLLAGPNGIAGEWGHTALPWPNDDERPGPACYCGQRGCVETWISGPGLAADHQRQTGVAVTAAELAQRREEPDVAATIARHADRFGRALAMVINVLDPHVVVLGGGVSNRPGLLEDIRATWHQHVFDSAGRAVVHTALRLATHGDSSGVRGAAWLWPERPR